MDERDTVVCEQTVNNEQTIDENSNFVLYTRRWVVLAVFSLVSMSNESIWISLSSITSIVRLYYRVDAITVNWLSMIYLVFLLLVALSSYFLNKYGLRMTVIVGALLNALGSCFRLAGSGRTGFAFVFIGSTFAAMAQCFLFFIPPRLAAVWFGEHERATASSVGMVLTFAGVALGFLTAASFVPSSHDFDHGVRVGMWNLLTFQAALCCFLALVSFFTIKDAPQTPPSRSQQLLRTESGSMEKNRNNGDSCSTLNDEDQAYNDTMPLIDKKSNDENISQETKSPSQLGFKESIITLMKSKHFHAIWHSFGIYFGVMNAFDTVLNSIITSRYPGKETEIGQMGFISVLCGTVGMLVCGILIDRTKWYKPVALVCFSVGAVLMVLLAIALKYHHSFYWLSALVILFGTCCHTYISGGLEYAADTTYPVHEGTSSAVLLFLGSLYSISLVYVVDALVHGGSSYLSGFVFAVLYVFGFILTCSVSPPLKRTQADRDLNF
ncbi:uncharacterized MFS-type transporter C09D4.1-like [Rhopilema esculentum]|uniref:uncharacterized MFS-type transporter C09D4.1-like n=1 Tax=Rhopilema esculentum TaxID=499914 RepID=UPI0031D5331F|eukprot:gene9348-17051_t